VAALVWFLQFQAHKFSMLAAVVVVDTQTPD
jgi:hypothetical protein